MANHVRPPPGPNLKISEADRQLLERTFVADDPAAIEGVLQVLPDGAKPVIRQRYDLTGSGRAKVHCAHCHARRHFRGFIVDLQGGGVALIGIDCGERAFGFDWDGVVEKFEADRDRQLDLRRLAAVAPLLPAFVAELDALDAAHVAHAYPAFFHDVLKTGKAGQRIARAVREGKMIAIQRTRDRRRELLEVRPTNPALLNDMEAAVTEAQIQRAKRRLGQWIDSYCQSWVEEEVEVGRLKHPHLFSPRTDVAGLKTALTLAKKAADALAHHTEVHADLGSIMRDVQSAVEGAKEAMDVLAALDEFTDPENLREVAGWLNSHGDEFVVNRRRLEDPIKGGFGVSSDWRLPATPELDRMLEALRGSATA